MKGLNAFLGWLLMLAVLAVPSFLFYNWWSKNKAQSAGDTVMAVPGKGVFSPVGKTAGGGVAVAVPVVVSRPVSAQVSTSTPRVEVSTVLPAAVQSAPVREPGISTRTPRTSYYERKTDRNPLFSPVDIQNIKDAELRLAEALRAERMAKTRQVKETGIETRMKLQGVVGNAAIINGEMYTAGQSIYGGKIIKVGTDYVIGEHKGRKFRIKIQ
ncbi:MAG: hypothetical protein A2234_00050 [Elusimicrobia bacterium RIFOXYA2_FULL_58_8]|nr:MAG: hypothetical protein A2285_05975 [Elusimicrobia bacterium RIFOXYA12_FULL_57_11]OGS15244.1 MAG: hypothetical protein A2234_00050 [Elusimicrobia bacterium RIFOXYA2_FULL_58_8]